MTNFAHSYYEKYWQHRQTHGKIYSSLPSRVKLVFKQLSLTPNQTILDIGTGEGSLGKALHGVGDLTIDGVEISQTAIKLAKSYYRQIFHGDITDNTFAKTIDNNYDTIVCLEVVEHLIQPACMIQTAFSKLKPGGVFYLSIPNTAWYKNRLALLRGEFLPDDPCFSQLDHLHHFTLSSISNLLTTHNFTIERIEGVYVLPWYFGKLPQPVQDLVGLYFPNLFGYQLLLKARKPFNKPTVAHLATDFVNSSESWLYNQVVSQTTFQPIVLTRNQKNSDQFPFNAIFAYPLFFQLADSTTPIIKKLFSLLQRLKDWFTNSEFDYYRSICKLHNVKLLHAHYGSTGYQALKLKFSLNLPLVVSFYGGDATWLPSHWPLWRLRFHFLFTHADAFIVKGFAMKQKLISLGCCEQKIFTLDHGIDLSTIPYTPPKPTNQPKLLVASRLVAFKGVDVAIKAMKILSTSHKKTSLTIIGSGPQEASLEALVSKLKLTNITFIPFMPHQKLLSIIKNFDIFLQPSITYHHQTEGNPTSLIERLAAGLPVVATDHADIPSVVHHGKNGYLVPESDPDALAAAIIKLIDHKATWSKFARYSRQLISKNFDLVTQTKRREDLYQSLTNITKSK